LLHDGREWKLMEQTLSDVFDTRQHTSCGDNMGNIMAQYLCTLEGWDLVRAPVCFIAVEDVPSPWRV
jgi:hypothetical protein